MLMIILLVITFQVESFIVYKFFYKYFVPYILSEWTVMKLFHFWR